MRHKRQTMRVIAEGLAPPPVRLATPSATVVAAELTSMHAEITFDTRARSTSVEATMVFRAGPDGGDPGWPAFDLRQPIDTAALNGDPLDPGELDPADLGGGPGAEMRVIRRELPSGRQHSLDLTYHLATPTVEDPLPIQWHDGAVSWDVWCSDLQPGRYLEQWFPVSVCQDRFALTLDLRVLGASVEHRLIANGAVDMVQDHRWRVTFPSHHTSLSSVVVLAPSTTVRSTTLRSRACTIEATAAPGIKQEVADIAERVAAWIEEDENWLGPYGHGDRFVVHAWESPRGMEYDGATTASIHALEHEVFHSWFGRGVKPAAARDGWIDEAVTTWATADPNAEQPRFAALELDGNDAPVVLAPASPWSRHTPREAYRTGYRVLAALANQTSTEELRRALATCLSAHQGSFLSTEQFGHELSEALGVDATPLWERFVHGRS